MLAQDFRRLEPRVVDDRLQLLLAHLFENGENFVFNEVFHQHRLDRFSQNIAGQAREGTDSGGRRQVGIIKQLALSIQLLPTESNHT